MFRRRKLGGELSTSTTTTTSTTTDTNNNNNNNISISVGCDDEIITAEHHHQQQQTYDINHNNNGYCDQQGNNNGDDDDDDPKKMMIRSKKILLLRKLSTFTTTIMAMMNTSEFLTIFNSTLAFGVILYVTIFNFGSSSSSYHYHHHYHPPHPHLKPVLVRKNSNFEIIMDYKNGERQQQQQQNQRRQVERPFQIYVPEKPRKSPRKPHYGDLEYESIVNNNNNNNKDDKQKSSSSLIFSRRIYRKDLDVYEQVREKLLNYIDEPKFKLDYQPDEDLQDVIDPSSCRRNNWKSQQFPTCNSVHELVLERPTSDMQPIEIKYLGHGYFRDAWLMNAPHVEEFVFKRLRLSDHFGVDYWDMYKIHREAIVMERLTSSSRIMNMYSFCSTTIFTEAMGSEVWKDMIPGTGRISQEALDQEQQQSYGGNVHPKNNFTAIEKLDMSIEMAEALADMHGFQGGVILHGDTHPEQWLRAKDGRLVLNDFNNAEILDYNDQKQEYCKIYRKYGGFYRAPEEYGNYIDESIDTFSLGNNIYCLLTGLWPFYPWESYHYIQGKLLRYERAYIDPQYRTRSFIEGKLVEIMEQTWEHKPEERISIFEVVDFLKRTKQEYHDNNNNNKNLQNNNNNNNSNRSQHYKLKK